MPPHLVAPNINHAWAALLVEELVRQGTTLFVVCPGSRSTPLAVAVGQNPRAEAVVHWDERAAGFLALGWGRATGRPAAVVTTSGTAVANLLPAAVEADADGVPLLLLTADRPAELRETGANQTVRQPPIFRDVARWALDAPVPTPTVPARWVLSTAAHAAHRAASPPGPVHLNLPFREPLGAQSDGLAAGYLAAVEGWARGGVPFTVAAEDWHGDAASGHVGADLLSGIASSRGLIVAGDLGGDAQAADAAIALAEALGWPLLPDLRSGLRQRRHPQVIAYVDLALVGSPNVLAPEVVVHLGGRLVSKRLARFLADARPGTYLRVAPDPVRHDPDALVTHWLRVPVRDGTARLMGARHRDDGTWLRRWQRASDAVAGALSGLDALSEPSLARMAARAEAGALVVAASMPVRDVEAFAAPRPGTIPVFANRGASGIDGTVATAAGVARGLCQPVVALVGDLALLHDQTSLALLRDGPPVVVVVVNNDGGGIFHRLPIADGAGALADDTFERFFGTPHGLTFEHAAAQAGLPYHQPTSLTEVTKALDNALASQASALVEVRTDREGQAALRAQVEAEVAEAVDRALAETDA